MKKEIKSVESSLLFKEINPCWVNLLDLNVLHLP